jgi:Lar family restriction alleviation protein
MNPQDDELKPCPFCGSSAEVHLWSYGDILSEHYSIRCKNGHETIGYKTAEQAMEIWNRRAPDALVERCYDAIIHSAEQIEMPDGRKLADWATLMNRLRDGYIAALAVPRPERTDRDEFSLEKAENTVRQGGTELEIWLVARLKEEITHAEDIFERLMRRDEENQYLQEQLEVCKARTGTLEQQLKETQEGISQALSILLQADHE